MNHKLEGLQLSMKDQASISSLRSVHNPDMICWLHKIGRALNTVCRKCGTGEETIEYVMKSDLEPTTQTLPNVGLPSQGLGAVGL